MAAGGCEISRRRATTDRPMKNLSWLIILSLAANAVLAGIYLKRHAPASHAAVSESAASDQKSESQDKQRSKLFGVRRSSETAESDTQTGRAKSAATAWKDLQSDDLKEFIRRLRGAGCPEETVRDIIVAE